MLIEFVAQSPVLLRIRELLQEVMLAVPIPERRQGHIDMAELEEGDRGCGRKGMITNIVSFKLRDGQTMGAAEITHATF